MDKANVDKILFNNPLPSMFNDWFTFVSAQHIYQISSTAEGKLSKLLSPIAKLLLYPVLQCTTKARIIKKLFLLQKLNNQFQMKI